MSSSAKSMKKDNILQQERSLTPLFNETKGLEITFNEQFPRIQMFDGRRKNRILWVG